MPAAPMALWAPSSASSRAAAALARSARGDPAARAPAAAAAALRGPAPGRSRDGSPRGPGGAPAPTRGPASPRPCLGGGAAAWSSAPTAPCGWARTRKIRRSSACARRAAPFEGPDGEGHVPRIDAGSLQPRDLLARVQRPAVLTNLAEVWPARHLWSTAYLASAHGHERVAVIDLPDEALEGDDVGEEHGGALYADHLRNAYVPFARLPEPLFLRDYLNHRFDDYLFVIGEDDIAGRLSADAFGGPSGLPALLAADDLTQLTFGVGPAGDGVALHAHTAAWNALMFGEKEWLFFPPGGLAGDAYAALALLEARSLAAAAGLEDAAGARAAQRAPGAGAPGRPGAAAGAAAAVAAAAAALSRQRPLRVRQRAGEVVWVPDGWWHATYSHTDTACLGGQRHKARLPAGWGAELLARWPACGLALQAAALERGDAGLFEEALRQEPHNLRFAAEYLRFCQERADWASVGKVAREFCERSRRARAEGHFARAELAAILAQFGEALYHAVDAAAAQCAAEDSSAASKNLGAMVELSLQSRALTEEALGLDRCQPLALSLLQAMDARAALAAGGAPPGALGAGPPPPPRAPRRGAR